ncbi:hypothetical protein BGZ61DRAFT_472454 [Ilyonectria robusta]|uniref:uncharacterized protein n=1 Tax=Ilyonectria robusta TaxID=1079257 RepID=UPI001E8CA34B|nr:uncharacterized protein BGZ61DRAFT_472454 [Ilyonectria robusta]KAH8736089.1 hypothetical protein BGZ61DRAFT_472454 [Ilyonectria robusta]
MFKKSKLYQSWDPRVLDAWVRYGLRELPTDLYPNDSKDGKHTDTNPDPLLFYPTNQRPLPSFVEAIAQRTGGTRLFCVICTAFTNDTESQFFQESDNESLLPDLTSQHGAHQQFLPTVDPRHLQVIPELDFRQADYSSSSSSPSSSLSPVAPDSTRDSTPAPVTTPGSTSPSAPPSVPSSKSREETWESPPVDSERLVLATVPALQVSSTGIASMRQFRCELGCSDRAFPSRRELERHHNSRQHRPTLYNTFLPGNSLQSACGIVLKRRDNYKRHVKKCDRAIVCSFRCDRGHTGDDKDAWLAHLDSPVCKPRRGAPPRRP